MIKWTEYGSHEFPDFDEDDILNLIVENKILKQELSDLQRQNAALIAEMHELELALQANNKLLQRRR